MILDTYRNAHLKGRKVKGFTWGVIDRETATIILYNMTQIEAFNVQCSDPGLLAVPVSVWKHAPRSSNWSKVVKEIV